MEIRTIQTTDQGITHIIDQIIKDQMIIIMKDHEIYHKTETQAIKTCLSKHTKRTTERKTLDNPISLRKSKK